jgi:hypothetical protein
MAFPGTYNINYYKGDTFEFRVYPKDASGAVFPLSQYVESKGVVKFSIAPARGALSPGQTVVEGFAEISTDNTNILCAITPANASELVAGTEYVYDVEIARASSNYDYVYTLLTGTISVTGQVTQPGDLLLPDHVDALTPIDLTANSISLSWTAPTITEVYGEVVDYDVYILGYTADPLVILGALQAGPLETITGTTYTFTGLTAETSYLVAIIASNGVGDADITTAIADGAVLGPITTTVESS